LFLRLLKKGVSRVKSMGLPEGIPFKKEEWLLTIVFQGRKAMHQPCEGEEEKKRRTRKKKPGGIIRTSGPS